MNGVHGKLIMFLHSCIYKKIRCSQYFPTVQSINRVHIDFGENYLCRRNANLSPVIDSLIMFV